MPQQQPGSYRGGEDDDDDGDHHHHHHYWWRKPEYPEETTDLRQVTDTFSHMRPVPSPRIELGLQRCEPRNR